MKKAIILIAVLAIAAAGQCLSGPMNTRLGTKVGITYSTFSPDDGTGSLSGIGFHIGIGAGFDLMNMIMIDLTPQFRTTSFGRTDDTWIGPVTTTFSYNNFFIPLVVSFKANTPSASPYLGAGIAGNFQLGGTIRIESGGSAWENEIESEDLEQDFFFIGALGVSLSAARMKVMPEISFNYNLTPDIPDPHDPGQSVEGDNFDLHFSAGIYFTP